MQEALFACTASQKPFLLKYLIGVLTGIVNAHPAFALTRSLRLAAVQKPSAVSALVWSPAPPLPNR
jgi:hypothetical protein